VRIKFSGTASERTSSADLSVSFLHQVGQRGNHEVRHGTRLSSSDKRSFADCTKPIKSQGTRLTSVQQLSKERNTGRSFSLTNQSHRQVSTLESILVSHTFVRLISISSLPDVCTGLWAAPRRGKVITRWVLHEPSVSQRTTLMGQECSPRMAPIQSAYQ
jgi:hypothetical protein